MSQIIEKNNRFYKPAQVFILDTNNDSLIYLEEGVLYYNLSGMYNKNTIKKANKHLYITSSEQPKEGDWCIVTVKDDTKIKYLAKVIVSEKESIYCDGDRKFSKQYYSFDKVIATTDCSLLVGLQISEDFRSTIGTCTLLQLPKEFIQAYVEACYNGNPIINILVEYEKVNNSGGQHCPLGLNVNDDIYDLKTSKDNTIIIKKKKENFKDLYEIYLFEEVLVSKINQIPFWKWLDKNYNPPTEIK